MCKDRIFNVEQTLKLHTMKNINFNTISKLLFISFFIAAAVVVLVDVFTNGAKI